MKKGNQYYILHRAIFMMCLVLSIPFISSQAFALTITSVTITGSDGVEDVMKSDNDYFTATVKTSEEIKPEQLYIDYTKKEAFDSCSGKECVYTSSQTDRAGQEMEYIIQLINSSIVVDEVEGTILIDEEEPTIDSYTVEKSDEDITISYEVTDTACEDCSVCAGIDYLTLYQDDTEIQTINVASECSIEDEISTSVTELNLEDGDHELCLVAVDNVGYFSDEYCEAISVDSTGPHFETGSLEIKESTSGNIVEYIGSDAVLVDVFINVTDDSLSENTVVGDFSALNAVIGSTYEEMTADSCEEDSDNETLWRCAWYALYIEDVSGSLTLPFSATDNEGNEGTYSPTYTLTKDDSAPTVYRVYNEFESEDLYLKYGTNSVYADLDATGSGFSFEQAYLTLSLASLSREDPTDCWENGSYWTCVWNFSMSYSGTTESTLVIDAEDDAGNAMESYEVDVGTDSEEPEILDITTSLDCPTAMDTLEVVVNATDDSDELFITFYGEDIRTDDEPITEECVKIAEDLFTCTLYITDFVSSPEDEDVQIEVSDNAGNIGDDSVDISVCELEEAGTPDFVTTYVGDVVDIDKLTLSYIDYPLYVPLTFSYTSAADIVSKTGSCENAGAVYFIDQSDTSTFMVVSLPAQAVPNATYSLNLDCSISFTMQYGDTVYSTPEVDEIEISVDLYGTPIGSVEASLAERIALQKQGIAEAQADIDALVGWNKVLGIMCKIVDMLTKADALLSGIRVFTTFIAYAAYGTYMGACTAVPWNIVACPTAGSGAWAVYAAMVQYETAANTYHSIIADFVWPVGYGSLSFGTVTKTMCSIYTGKLCEGFGGIENKILINAREQGTPAYYEKSVGVGEGFFGQEDQQLPESFPEEIGLFYDWDPYKSIHTAQNCLYIDAIIYNMRKERQINCMYTRCLENNAENGLPIDVCDLQYKERQCLYVDGAAWMAAGSADFIHFLQLTLNTALSNAGVIILGTAYWFIPPCSFWEVFLKTKAGIAEIDAMHMIPFIGPIAAEVVPGQGMVAGTACHGSYNILALVETNWFYGVSDWDFEANLEGTDYCAGY
ncbi:hypothetical protein HZC31_00270 [Candidatus Woesearchaeota archaeon]|nr:hypothetical protein [Candidatus Woesearchaeota archaeon]